MHTVRTLSPCARAQIQTEPCFDELNSLDESVLSEVAAFLRRVLPFVEAQLRKNAESQAFADYDVLSLQDAAAVSRFVGTVT